MGADGHVRIEISGDSTPLEKDLQRVEKEADDSMSAVKEGAQKAEDALNDMGEAARDACNSKVTGGLEDVADALADVGDNAGDAGKGVEDTGKKAESVWKKLEGMSESAADLQDALANTVEQSAATIGKTFAVVGAGVTAVGTATAGVLVNLGNGYNKAVNQISAATGTTGKELEQLGQIAQNVYSHNFGDSLEDVADGISVVRQNTQLMGEELQAATEDGFALRDTFGYDLSESARTASALMKNFSIDANKAYNIIATGAQKGADQNGDLLDTLNEYSTQYAALGLSADQFVNGLIAGAEAGVFSIDKVGDAVKEFNIRAKDGSKSTTSAFATLGLKASTTMQAFAKGGDTAQKAFFEVVKALEAMKDPVEKNQTAVALFGTQYEDLEKTVLPVLASMEDASKTTYDALGEINEIKYKDLGSALQGLKRTIEGALIPSASKIASGPMMTAMQELQRMANDLAKSIKAGEYDSVFAGIADGITGVVKALPKVRDGIQKIAPVVSNIASITTGFLSAAVENIDLVVAAIAGVGTAIAALKLLTFIGDAIKAVQALGAAFTLSTGPIGLAVLAISGVVAAIAQYVALSDDADQAAYDSVEATRALREESEKLTAEYEQNREARLKSAETAEAETATAELYAGKLEELAKKRPNFHVIFADSVKQWIVAADSISIWMSTAIAEVYMAGKSCHILRPVPIEHEYDPVIYKDAHYVTRYDEFAAAMAEPEPPFPIAKDVIEGYFDPGEMPAYKRMADLLEDVYKNPPRDEPMGDGFTPHFNKLKFCALAGVHFLYRRGWEPKKLFAFCPPLANFAQRIYGYVDKAHVTPEQVAAMEARIKPFVK